MGKQIGKEKNMKKKGFTLIELLVVIAIIAMLLAILMPALNKVKKIAMRVICGTNLKGLGTAQTVYANDYDDEYVVQGGNTNPSWVTSMGVHWYNPNLQWGTADLPYVITTGSSLYLLVREADVSPKSFVCPAGAESEFDGKNPPNLDLTQLWDFGTTPNDTVSYSYHMPYKGSAAGTGTKTGTAVKGKNAANGQKSAAFAVMGDRNPFADKKLVGVPTSTQNGYVTQVAFLQWQDTAQRYQVQAANAQPHDRDGQNVTYADGHNSYETRSDVGVKNDNVYTRWTSTSPAQTDQNAWRAGTIGVGTLAETNYPRSSEDSILVNENIIMPNPTP
jgi:prepilin-type N-terminal cleavage/methylation domain-containing protein